MASKTALLIVTDLGRFKAFRYEEDPHFSHPRLQPLEEWETEVLERLSDQLTDQAGQFQKGSRSFAAINDGANGERHNLKLEIQRRALRKVANRITELLNSDGVQSCFLAAGHEISGAILDALDPKTRARVERKILSNLTRIPTADLIEHLK